VATRRVTSPASPDARAAAGKAARTAAPLDSHADIGPDAGRDPVALLRSQESTRVAELVPIRYGRMLASPFAFLRGAALPMAADLASTVNSGLRVQLCGDAHLSNFGVFGSPERSLVFDLNDFDETAPGPFEWDVKRLAASIEVAGRGNGFTAKQRRAAVLAAARSYRESMREFSGMGELAVWYLHLSMDQVLREHGDELDEAARAQLERALAKARSKDSRQAFAKLTEAVDGRVRIRSDPPLVVPAADLARELGPAAQDMVDDLGDLLRAYRRTLQPDRRALLDRYDLVDIARKVVGVGSVGTRAWILLLIGRDDADPLFLQAKEAQASVLEQFTGRAKQRNHGQRVVEGQRLLQASSDIMLGWQRTTGPDGVERDYYVRQLRDWKGSVDVERLSPTNAVIYARMCGWTLARAHARSGDRIAIAAYLGRKDRFDRAIADFAVSYADRTEVDHRALHTAVDRGLIEAKAGL
jgi:uncharacterized protein (DUF2252 family)